jgi:hypothetical protein
VLSGRVSHSSSGDQRVPKLRKSSMAWIWQHDKRIDDNKIIFNCSKKLMKNKIIKRGRERLELKKLFGMDKHTSLSFPDLL